MSIAALAFYMFAITTITGGFFTVVSRNPVHSVLWLILAFLSSAGLFVLLGAYFLAAVQILVYAGAVMVLFLFVIMLLDLREGARRKLNLVSLTMGLLAVGALFLVHKVSIDQTYGGEAPRREAVADAGQAEAKPVKAVGSTRALGQALFSPDNGFILPFEIVSVLLLVAMVGVILLSRKEPR